MAAPRIFGVEIGFNLPAFIIALVITFILCIGIKESASFNATIVVIKVSVVLFVIGLGARYISTANWGTDWHSFAPYGFSGIGAGAAYIFFAYIGFDAVSTTAQEAKNPQRDLPIGIIVSLLVCTALYIMVAGVLTGMVRWQDINIEAPVARAFLDRGLTAGVTHYYFGRACRADQRNAGDAAGANARVVFHGQRRIVAEEILCGGASEVADSLQEHDRGGLARGDRREHYADRRYRAHGEYRDAAGVCDRVHCGDGFAQYEPGAAAAVSDAMGAGGADPGNPVQRLHDVQAGLGELGAVDHLAGHRVGGLFRV